MPPPAALRWVERSVGRGARVRSVRRFAEGGWHANHAVNVERDGRMYRLVLRRWDRPEWRIEDPGFTVEREMRALEIVEGGEVPTPRVVAADPDGSRADVPAVLLTRLRGSPGRAPAPASFVAQLAAALREIHALAGVSEVDREYRGKHRTPLPPYRPYFDARTAGPPAAARKPALWNRALEIVRARRPPAPHGLVHRDFHAGNVLWWRGRLSGVVDWTQASRGPQPVDLAHMRANLVVQRDVATADAFLDAYGPVVYDAYWDVLGVLDLSTNTEGAELRRLERFLGALVESMT